MGSHRAHGDLGSSAALTPIIVAHRAGNRPESVAPALRRADIVESDVHVFRGRVEVRHEKVIRPTSRLWERWYLLPPDTPVPTIESILAAMPADVPMLLDLKCFTRRAGRRIRRAIPDGQPLLVSCRSWWVLSAFRDRPRTVMLRSCGGRRQLWAATRISGLSDRVGVVAHNRLLNKDAIGAVLSRTPLLFAWAVETTDRGRQLAANGVAGLIIDDLEPNWADLQMASDSLEQLR